MKHEKKISSIICLLVTFLFFSSCKKFLDEKPNKILIIPTTLKHLQALLDNNYVMNSLPIGAGEASSDNYYLSDVNWTSYDDAARSIYIWGEDIVYTTRINAWNNSYTPVFSSNTVLEVLAKISRNENNKLSWDNCKGSALFFRARSFLTLVTTFAKAYDSSTANQDLGIPLRLDPDFNIVSVRTTVEQSYAQVIKDATESIHLLPDAPLHVMRPSKAAAYALLSRTYLSMRRYDQAELYADSCLKLFNALIDYNQLVSTAAYPIAPFNKEVIFSTNGVVQAISPTKANIDSNLYRSYADNDCRKTVFFLKNADDSYRFKGSYFGNDLLFTGIASDEVYLTKAECLARRGEKNLSLAVLDRLLIKRWNPNATIPAKPYQNMTADNAEEALTKILIERRKELLMRDLRWIDLKRLNKEPGREVTVRRKLKGQVYELLPNDNRYALPIPKVTIDLTGMPQNPR